MILKSIASLSLLFIWLSHPLLARPHVSVDLPDLQIKQYEFVYTNDKRLRVQVGNYGKAASRPCRLELAIRKVNGTAVTRTADETIPALEPGKEAWVTLSATGILPAAISLQDTTFRLTADETNVVAESNEDNNELWHNSN
jgi:subtilase family serine protease